MESIHQLTERSNSSTLTARILQVGERLGRSRSCDLESKGSRRRVDPENRERALIDIEPKMSREYWYFVLVLVELYSFAVYI